MGDIVAHKIGKAYREYPSKWSRFFEWFVPFSGIRYTPNWILRDVSFEIGAGEAVAIIGFNGAGKSTLLKMIAGTLVPTEGSLVANGKVAALLELGMGFHEQFTGRQNVYMAGQLMGFSVSQIKALMPEIEAFAEIGSYIDKPLRTYSSGMHVRLAFSIATATRPDILIVDEALSVGDAYFQHKSFERIQEFKKQGTTLLIVSHDRYAVESLCDRAILLNNGVIESEGDTAKVMDYYHALMGSEENRQIIQDALPDGSYKTISGSNEVSVVEVFMLNSNGERKDTFEVGENVELVIDLKANLPVDKLTVGFLLKSKFGQEIYGINTHRLGMPVENLKVGEILRYSFSFCVALGPNNYSVSISLSRDDSHVDKNYQWIDRALLIHVINRSRENFVGCNWLNAQANIKR